MFQDTWTDEDQQAVEQLAKKLCVDLDAEQVAGKNATFAQIEATASKLGKAITRQVAQDLALQQTELLKPPQPCPTCAALCDVEVRQRKMTIADGPIELGETACNCSVCNRDFFPSACSLGAASRRKPAGFPGFTAEIRPRRLWRREIVRRENEEEPMSQATEKKEGLASETSRANLRQQHVQQR